MGVQEVFHEHESSNGSHRSKMGVQEVFHEHESSNGSHRLKMGVQEVFHEHESSNGSHVPRLPKYVVFKGDNDMYLAAHCYEGHEHLQFRGTDIGSGEVGHEVVEVSDGNVMLRSLYWNKFWRRNPNWIWADTSTGNSCNKDMLFKPIKVDDKRVALRCLGNNGFCTRLSKECQICLNARTWSLERNAIFRLEEPTLSRKVYSVQYHTDKARIYDLVPENLYRTTVKNPSDQLASLQVSYAYMEKKSTSWKCSQSFKTGIKATFEVGIPYVADAKIEISGEFTYCREWGETEEKQTTVTGTYNTPVKGGQTVEVTVTGVHARCDVPFSYVQEDLLTTGEYAESTKADGIYSGLNTTDIKFGVRYI